jgi:hypothetical protein
MIVPVQIHHPNMRVLFTPGQVLLHHHCTFSVYNCYILSHLIQHYVSYCYNVISYNYSTALYYFILIHVYFSSQVVARSQQPSSLSVFLFSDCLCCLVQVLLLRVELLSPHTALLLDFLRGIMFHTVR